MEYLHESMNLNDKMNIVVLDGFTLNPGDLEWTSLSNLGKLVVYDRTVKAQVVARALQADIVLTNKVVLDNDILERLPKLKLIVVLATGFNHIDVEAASKLGITICNASNYSSSAVAQHCFALLLEMTNRCGLHEQEVKSGGWSDAPDWSYHSSQLIEIAGKTIGLIGYGNIAKKVAKIALGFGLKVMATRKNLDGAMDTEVELVTLDHLLADSDIISLHCPLTPSTKRVINAKKLQLMKPTSILINTSRGELIDEEDLYNALTKKTIAGACLDVLQQEPPPHNHQLFTLKNCIITPHHAWATKSSRQRLMDISIRNVAAFLSGSPINTINNSIG